jgi:F-type H+-transporting ATPase subunit epsilon
MAEKKIHLRIVTPTEVKVDEKIDMAILRCIDGEWGVLANHDDNSNVLDYGVMRVFNDEREHVLAVYGGLAEVKDNVLTVLTQSALNPDDIDRELAEANRDAAEAELKTKLGTTEQQNYHAVMLRRALVEIEVSTYPLLNPKISSKEPDEK